MSQCVYIRRHTNPRASLLGLTLDGSDPPFRRRACLLDYLPLLVRSCGEVVSQLRIRNLWLAAVGFLAIPTYCISAETLRDALSEAYASN
jgi:hypothetical protein